MLTAYIKSSIVKRCFRFAVLLLLHPLNAAASEVLYSNLGAGDSFSSATAWAVSYHAPPANSQSTAFSFVSPNEGYFYLLESIELPISNLSGPDSPAFAVGIYDDAGNRPGSLLGIAQGSAPLGPVPSSLTTAYFPPFHTGEFVQIERNTRYWIGVHPDSPATTSLGWWHSIQPTAEHSTYFLAKNSANVLPGGSWENSFVDVEGAFRLNARIFGEYPQAAVPLPAANWLMLSGMFGVLLTSLGKINVAQRRTGK